MSKDVHKASCWDCQDSYIGKTKRRLHDRKTEHFKAITSDCHASAIADHVTSTGHNLKWDHFDILGKGRSDRDCKIKETLLIRELKPTLNDMRKIESGHNLVPRGPSCHVLEISGPLARPNDIPVLNGCVNTIH